MPIEVKASTAYTICNIIIKCLAFITLPLFTRIMSTEEYGLSTVYASTAAIVVIFTSLQLPYGTLSTAMVKFKNDREGYLASICGICCCLTFIYTLLCYFFSENICNLLDLPVELIYLMGIEMLFATSIAAWMAYQRFEYRYKNVVILTVAIALFSTIISVIYVFLSEDKGLAKVYSNAFVTIIVGLYIFLLIIRKGKEFFNMTYWKFALSFNIPLVPYYLSQIIFNQSDRLMINSICGRSDAAIYGIAYTLATILVFVVTSIHSAYTPWVFTRIDNNDFQSNKKVILLLASGVAFMLVVVIALAPEIVYIFGGDKYAKAIWAVPPIAISVLLLYYADLFDCFLFFYEAKIQLVFAAILSAVVNIFLNYIFIPRFGFIAAAYTTLISYMVLAIIDYYFMKKICIKHIGVREVYDINKLISIFLMFLIIGFSMMAFYERYLLRYTFILILLMLAIRKYTVIIEVYRQFKN